MKTKLITRIELLESKQPQDSIDADFTKFANRLSKVYGNGEKYTYVSEKEFMAAAEKALQRVYGPHPSCTSSGEGQETET